MIAIDTVREREPQRQLSRLWSIVDRLLPRSAPEAFFQGFAAALVIACAAMTVLPALLQFKTHFGGGSQDGYWELAENLAHGHGYVFEPGGAPVLHRPFLLPLVYSPLTMLPEGLQRLVLTFLQSLVFGGVCFLLFDLGSRLRATAVARVTVAGLLLYPWFYVQVKNPINVVVQMFWIVLIVYLIAREFLGAFSKQDRSLPGRWSASAALLGLTSAAAVLTHGTMLLSVGLLLAGTTLAGVIGRSRRLALVPVVAACTAAVLVAPWTYRNWTVAHRFIPVATNAGFAYFWGNAHWELGGGPVEEQNQALRLAGIARPAAEVVHFSGIKERHLDELLDRKMVEDIKARPAAFVRKCFLNASEFYFPIVYDLIKPESEIKPKHARFFRIERLVQSLWHFAMWGLALLGLWRCRTARGSFLAMLLLLGGLLALVLPFFPFLTRCAHCRYAQVALPLLGILTANGLVELLPHFSRAHPPLFPKLRKGRVAGGHRATTSVCDKVL